MLSTLVLLFALVCNSQAGVTVQVTSGGVQVANGYLNLRFNFLNPQIDILQADFTGQGQYGANLVAAKPDQLNRQGIVLERDSRAGGNFQQFASSTGPCSGFAYHIPVNTAQLAIVEITGVCDSPSNPLITSNWTIYLEENSRVFGLAINGSSLSASNTIVDAKISLYASTPSVYGLFNNRGMRQMMNSQNNYFASNDSLYYFYTLGLAPTNNGAGGCIDLNATGYEEIVLLSGTNQSPYRSGIQLVWAGSYPVRDNWDGSGWQKAGTASVSHGESFSLHLKIGLNDNDFPAGAVTNSEGLPLEHTQAIYTAIYASTIGAIPSYLFAGAFAPTLATPTISYTGLYTFYDPDSFFAISSLTYSGDDYLFNQAKQAIELSERWMKPSGQIPHHFIDTPDNPTYIAISGATQTGPNIFWTLSALRIGRMSGDYEWLAERLPAIEASLTFLLATYNSTVGLISTKGSLYIDTFIRQNFTADSNVAMVYLLNQIAEAEEFFGKSENATVHRALATSFANAINEYLWAKSNDHYITNLSPNGDIRDFVDYDSNTLSIAFGVAPALRIAPILKRVDSGKCTHARATYVSEIYYNASNCFVDNTGDSAVTMGRIGWGDGVARYNVGDYDTFYNLIYNPLLKDLLQNTWMYERFTCQATPTHNPYYHEYPETVAMLTREAVYGIYIGLLSIRIAPFPQPPATTSQFVYNIGNTNISYSQAQVTITIPGASSKNITIESLYPSTKYQIQELTPFFSSSVDAQVVSTDSEGILNFAANTGLNVTVWVEKLSASAKIVY